MTTQQHELASLSKLFKLMGDLTRMKLLFALESGEVSVNELADRLNMTKSAISHQLRALRDAKLVKARKDGKYVYYSLDDWHVKEILDRSLEHIREL